MKLVFITTAAEAEQGDMTWVDNDRNGLKEAGFDMFDYTITGKNYSQIKKDLKDVDVVHVNGGNTFYLLLQARKSGFDQWIVETVDQGKIYIGSSAGSIIASPDIGITAKLETEIYEKQLGDFKGFGLTDILILPHWGSDVFRDLYLNQRLDLAYKPENKIVLLNDYQYLKITEDNMKFVDVRGEQTAQTI